MKTTHKKFLQWFAQDGAEGGGAAETAENTPQEGGTEPTAEAQKETPHRQTLHAEERQARAAGTLKRAHPLASVRYGRAAETLTAEGNSAFAENADATSAEQARTDGRETGTPDENAKTEPTDSGTENHPDGGREAQVRAIRESWHSQSEALKKIYPEFDFAAERSNGTFANLLRRGVPVRSAYEAAHFDELVNRAVRHTAREVERNVTRRMTANRARPGENGLRPGGAVTMKADVAALSRADREEIERRVRHGEKITF